MNPGLRAGLHLIATAMWLNSSGRACRLDCVCIARAGAGINKLTVRQICLREGVDAFFRLCAYVDSIRRAPRQGAPRPLYYLRYCAARARSQKSRQHHPAAEIPRPVHFRLYAAGACSLCLRRLFLDPRVINSAGA